MVHPDDIENQKALRLAHQVDREGRRTIGIKFMTFCRFALTLCIPGVMTKPDMLTIGSTKARDLWLDVIEGRRHSLTHGYYCTRQPDDAERSRGITSADARVAESTYFKDTSPWSTSVHKHRFGTNNLISTLSTLLVQIIKDTYVVWYLLPGRNNPMFVTPLQASKSPRRNHEVSCSL